MCESLDILDLAVFAAKAQASCVAAADAEPERVRGYIADIAHQLSHVQDIAAYMIERGIGIEDPKE